MVCHKVFKQVLKKKETSYWQNIYDDSDEQSRIQTFSKCQFKNAYYYFTANNIIAYSQSVCYANKLKSKIWVSIFKCVTLRGCSLHNHLFIMTFFKETKYDKLRGNKRFFLFYPHGN